MTTTQLHNISMHTHNSNTQRITTNIGIYIQFTNTNNVVHDIVNNVTNDNT